MNISNQKALVKIKSKDRRVIKKQEIIERKCHFELWVRKAIVLLDKYRSSLNSLDCEQDPVQRGIKIQDIECYFMTSVSLFLRCFMDCNGCHHLKIGGVTKDRDLHFCYASLKELRDDEYVHWKGLRSKIDVNCYFNINSIENKLTPCNPLFHLDYEDKIGPKDNEKAGVDKIKELYNVTLNYINDSRNKEYNDMLLILNKNEVFNNTEFLNKNDESL